MTYIEYLSTTSCEYIEQAAQSLPLCCCSSHFPIDQFQSILNLRLEIFRSKTPNNFNFKEQSAFLNSFLTPWIIK